MIMEEQTFLIPLPQVLFLGFRRGAAAGVNSELLLTGCSSSAASVGQPLLPAAMAHRGMLCLRCLIKGSLLQKTNLF